MRTIQQIKEHATNNDLRIWSDEVSVWSDELRHLLAIASARHATKQARRDVYLLNNGPDIVARNAALRRMDECAAAEDAVYAAAVAAGLYGEVKP